MLHLAHIQPVGPVVIGRVDIVRRTDDPDPSIDGRLKKLAGLRVVAIEPARLLGENQIPPLGLDPGPDLVDPRPRGQFSGYLRLADELHIDLLGGVPLRQTGGQERLAQSNLVVDARLPLLLGGEPGMDQDVERPAQRHLDGLSEVHHRAPPFRDRRPLAGRVPDSVPGAPLPFRFSRVKPGLFSPCRGYWFSRVFCTSSVFSRAS